MRLGIVSDIHVVPAGTPSVTWHNPYPFDRATEFVEKAVAFFNERELDAVLVLGDLTHFGDEPSTRQAVSLLSRLNAPAIAVAGNHDTALPMTDWRVLVDGAGAGRLTMANGAPLATAPALRGIGAINRVDEPRGYHIPEGAVEAPDGDPLVVFGHFPLLVREDEALARGLKYAGLFHWGSDEARLRERTAPTVHLHGHLHIRHSVIENAVLQLGFAALIEPPHAVALLEINDRDGGLDVAVEHFDVVPYEAEVVPILSPARESWTFRDGGWAAG
jgi:calcineurin-like phosphoesterase family protein